MARPGIMLYFDILGPIRVLPDADKGRLLVAMLEYGKDGTAPKFDGMLALAWEFVRPKIDKDNENYDRSIQQKQYASFSREAKKLGLPVMPFDDWKELSEDERHRLISADIERYPTTTTTTKSTTTTSAAATATETEPCEAAAADTKVQSVCGELGKGVVFLSDAQMGDLLDRMGLEVFDYYIEKLAAFIIKNDAHIRNHYETILEWWQKDGGLHTKK